MFRKLAYVFIAFIALVFIGGNILPHITTGTIYDKDSAQYNSIERYLSGSVNKNACKNLQADAAPLCVFYFTTALQSEFIQFHKGDEKHITMKAGDFIYERMDSQGRLIYKLTETQAGLYGDKLSEVAIDLHRDDKLILLTLIDKDGDSFQTFSAVGDYQRLHMYEGLEGVKGVVSGKSDYYCSVTMKTDNFEAALFTFNDNTGCKHISYFKEGDKLSIVHKEGKQSGFYVRNEKNKFEMLLSLTK
ncbi:hypothetical protein [Lelliottia wanjuensis]|uniref:hypothetical protein n=1 Tax=Lelliottia wanjuensis TaxID=3050585 RepID=UPI0025514013|nr:hypothetical protein [Lelliottia sp. V86_10]MDK9585868.1 hypothetical protein [Lelliottia sp. V86_10]